MDLEGFPERTPRVGANDGRMTLEGKAQPPASCVTLGKLLGLSGLVFSSAMTINSGTYLKESLRGVKEIMSGKYGAKCVAWSEYLKYSVTPVMATARDRGMPDEVGGDLGQLSLHLG